MRAISGEFIDGEVIGRDYSIVEGTGLGDNQHVRLTLYVEGSEIAGAYFASLDEAKTQAEQWEAMRLVKKFVPFMSDSDEGYNDWSLAELR